MFLGQAETVNTKSFQRIVTLVESFQEATDEHALVKDTEELCCHRLPNMTTNEIVTNQISRLDISELVDSGLLTLHLKTREETTSIEDIDFL